AADEALAAWFGASAGDDRCVRVGADAITPPALQRSVHAAILARLDVLDGRFDSERVLRTARAALTRGTALLAVSDWFDLPESLDTLLAELGARYDCTALVARDPWYDELPLSGMVRLRGAEGGFVRAYVGERERRAYGQAVRERESALVQRFARANWRTGILHEADGKASLEAAFGIAR
ncbi:MAG TPA: hypothetical protein VKR05_07625, partial [Candidatus Cybelea sp.]|nr:hypothetical protein [Candidatus Cybelea sp.]